MQALQDSIPLTKKAVQRSAIFYGLLQSSSVHD
jgi:hypothetical protein